MRRISSHSSTSASRPFPVQLPEVPFHRMASRPPSASSDAASTIFCVWNWSISWLPSVSVFTGTRLKCTEMRELICFVIAIVNGSSAVFEEGVMKPTFLSSFRLASVFVLLPIELPSMLVLNNITGLNSLCDSEEL